MSGSAPTATSRRTTSSTRWGGLAYLVGGNILLDRRPGNLIGPLVIAYGMVGYSGNCGNADVPVMPLLGASIGMHRAFYLHR